MIRASSVLVKGRLTNHGKTGETIQQWAIALLRAAILADKPAQHSALALQGDELLD